MEGKQLKEFFLVKIIPKDRTKPHTSIANNEALEGELKEKMFNTYGDAVDGISRLEIDGYFSIDKYFTFV